MNLVFAGGLFSISGGSFNFYCLDYDSHKCTYYPEDTGNPIDKNRLDYISQKVNTFFAQGLLCMGCHKDLDNRIILEARVLQGMCNIYKSIGMDMKTIEDYLNYNGYFNIKNLDYLYYKDNKLEMYEVDGEIKIVDKLLIKPRCMIRNNDFYNLISNNLSIDTDNYETFITKLSNNPIDWSTISGKLKFSKININK